MGDAEAGSVPLSGPGVGEKLIEGLREARQRVLDLQRDLDGEQLLGPAGHFIEPPLWELGHVGWFQELWILRHLAGAETLLDGSDGVYDAFNVSYKKRWDHDFPSRERTLGYIGEVLERCAARLNVRQPDARDLYFYRLVINHEDMHAENMIVVRQDLGYPEPAFTGASPATEPQPEPGFEAHDVAVPGGEFLLGALPDSPFVFDNEKWAHLVPVESFSISATAVTNDQYREFVEDAGYETPRYWGKHGWEWRRRDGAKHPSSWRRESNGSWSRRQFHRWVPLEPTHPVCGVNWNEANAWCKWAGRRLPSEIEWEVAASGETGADGNLAPTVKRLHPWGDEPFDATRANLDARLLGCVDVRALPAGDSAFGCRQMLGNVWEWTSSTLEPYPGFEVDPYAEYSQPYFGQKKVLRGGGWMTRSRLIRTTWRNFYIRHRRNICAGFRSVAL